MSFRECNRVYRTDAVKMLLLHHLQEHKDLFMRKRRQGFTAALVYFATLFGFVPGITLTDVCLPTLGAEASRVMPFVMGMQIISMN